MTPWIELYKPRLAALAALSAAAGYLLAARRADPGVLAPLGGCFLLAAGGCALNQLQEFSRDRRMDRTRGRPLPSGRLSAGQVLTGAVIPVAAGTALLLTAGWLPAALGLAALAWYNGLYTPLKRRTAFAAVPGAVVGMAPPAIGWAAAPAAAFGPGLAGLMVFLFLWQIPHFWLLLLLHPEDCRRAGLPSPIDRLGQAGLARVSFSWIAATAAAGLTLPLFGLYRVAFGLPLLLLAAWLVIGATPILRAATPARAVVQRSIYQINLFALATIVLVVVETGILPLVSNF